MVNGDAWLRLDFIVQNSLHRPTFESLVGTKLAEVPFFNTQINGLHRPSFESLVGTKIVSLNITAAQLLHCLIMSMVNGDAWLRLDFIVQNGLHRPTFESFVGTKLLEYARL
eukprot:scaffold10232_cov46-Cyclotella_meneghiniana.AAC.4